MISSDLIIAEMVDHFTNFIEVLHPAFAGLPLCPFAKKARLDDKLKWVVAPLSLSTILETGFGDYKAIIFVHPTKDFDLEELAHLATELNQQLVDCHCFGGHPQSNLQLKGVYTRRDPYPNLQLIKNSELDDAQKKLINTRWYDGLSVEEMRDGLEISEEMLQSILHRKKSQD